MSHSNIAYQVRWNHLISFVKERTQADVVAPFICRIGREHILEANFYTTYKLWEGTGHLRDIDSLTPSFHKSQHADFLACTAHIVDIGGRGFGGDHGAWGI